MRLTTWFNKKIIQYFNKKVSENRSYLCDFTRLSDEILPADVLLIEGSNRISKVINKVTISVWSHAAIYIGKIQDIENTSLYAQVRKKYQGNTHQQLLIESIIGKGTVITPLTFYKDHHLRICRPTGISTHNSQQVIKYALSHVGQQYNIKKFLDLGRFLLRSKFIPIRIGSSLFNNQPNSTSSEICSEMIANAFASIHFPILPVIKKNDPHQPSQLIRRNTKLTTPSDFDYSPYFEIIKYPIFLLGENMKYTDLPWAKGHISLDGENISKTTPTKQNPQKKQLP